MVPALFVQDKKDLSARCETLANEVKVREERHQAKVRLKNHPRSNKSLGQLPSVSVFDCVCVGCGCGPL